MITILNGIVVVVCEQPHRLARYDDLETVDASITMIIVNICALGSR